MGFQKMVQKTNLKSKINGKTHPDEQTQNDQRDNNTDMKN